MNFLLSTVFGVCIGFLIARSSTKRDWLVSGFAVAAAIAYILRIYL